MNSFFSTGGLLPLWLLGVAFVLALVEWLRTRGRRSSASPTIT